MHLLLRVVFICVVFCLATGSRAAVIEGYDALFAPLPERDGKVRLAIRRFLMDRRPMLLVVDPETFETSLAPAEPSIPIGSPVKGIDNTPYMRALQQHTSPPYRLHNGGARQASPGADGFFLTVDLCPSSKTYERELFLKMKDLPQHKPVPVGLAVTKLWMERHGEALDEILALARSGVIAITWINHSATHPYRTKEPLEKNFLLTPGSDFRKEVLETEQALLEKGLLPSPFFRFPGLVADGVLMEQLRGLGLIPLGSDAWLAKGEKPAVGSIILVHGNGNEPLGVKLLMQLLKSEEKKPLNFLPLQAAFR